MLITTYLLRFSIQQEGDSVFDKIKGGYFRSEKSRTVTRTAAEYELELCLSSDAESYLNGKKYLRIKDSILFAKPGETRRSAGKFQCFFLHFTCSDKEFCEKYLNLIPTQIFSADCVEIKRTIQSIMLIIGELPEQKSLTGANRRLVGAMMTAMLLKLYLLTENQSVAVSHRYASNIAKACEYIEQNFRSNISIDDIAAAALLSPGFTYVEFKKETGFTPHEYLLNKRLCYARDRLIFTDKPITQISCECGFANPNYLNCVFKKKYKTTPKKFRNEYRKSIQHT